MRSINVSVTVQPMRDAGPLTVEMVGHIPRVMLRTEYGAPLDILLSNHDDPARWLRESAAALLTLAEQVEARVTA